MELENEKGIFDIENGSTLNIERTNPLLTDQGSVSLPYPIMRTEHNDRLLDLPQNYARENRYKTKHDVNIRAGMLNENATLEILSVDSQKVESVFLLYESSFYQQIKEVTLPKVFEGIERHFQDISVPLEDRIRAIVTMFERMFLRDSSVAEDFTVLPAVSECEILSRMYFDRASASAPSQNILNEFFRHYISPGNALVVMRARFEYEYTDKDGNIIKVPMGYGASPFLRLGYVLRKIFDYFGLYLEPTVFETDGKFRCVVVPNNTQDAILLGYLIESQLVPDCTVNDFLDIIRKGFCGDFVIDVPNKRAKLIFFNEVIDAQPDVDMSEYLTAPFKKIQLAVPKQVKLSVGKSLPFAATAIETLYEFEKKYPFYKDEVPDRGEEGIFPSYNRNHIWKYSEPLPLWVSTEYKTDRLSSMNFDYRTPDDIELEEHTIPFDVPVMVCIDTAPSWSIEWYSFQAMVIGTFRNLNSFVMLDGTKIAEESTTCPVMLTLEKVHGYMRVPIPSDTAWLGLSLYTWDEHGLFNKFWKKYDTLLRTSFHTITYKAMVPAHVIQSFRFDRLKLIDGQPLLPISLRYEITDNDLIDVEMEFKTGKEYKAAPSNTVK